VQGCGFLNRISSRRLASRLDSGSSISSVGVSTISAAPARRALLSAGELAVYSAAPTPSSLVVLKIDRREFFLDGVAVVLRQAQSRTMFFWSPSCAVHSA